jgi:glycosyltransferase involved in cell wall biosynthesis
VQSFRLSMKSPLSLGWLSERTQLPYRVIVADDGSSDDTATKALALPVTLLQHAFVIARLRLRYCEVPVAIKYTQYSPSKDQSSLNGLNILWDMIRVKL